MARSWSRSALASASGIAARIAGAAAPATTWVRVAGGGGRLISAVRSASWRRTRRALSASSTGWSSRRCRERVTMPGSPGPSMISCAWLAVNTSKAAICQLMRIAWRSVGRICERVAAEGKAGRDLLGGLKAIGFDEISVRKGQRYIVVVVDHHTGRLVWAPPPGPSDGREVPGSAGRTALRADQARLLR